MMLNVIATLPVCKIKQVLIIAHYYTTDVVLLRELFAESCL